LIGDEEVTLWVNYLGGLQLSIRVEEIAFLLLLIQHSQ
jgi:hypothetical protein